MSRIFWSVLLLSLSLPAFAEDGPVESDSYVHSDIAQAAREWRPKATTSTIGTLIKGGAYGLLGVMVINAQADAAQALPRLSQTLEFSATTLWAPLLDLSAYSFGTFATGTMAATVNRALKSGIASPFLGTKLRYDPSFRGFFIRWTATYATAIGMANMMPTALHSCAKLIAHMTQ